MYPRRGNGPLVMEKINKQGRKVVEKKVDSTMCLRKNTAGDYAGVKKKKKQT